MGHGIAAGVACVATVSAWAYARWWTVSLISGFSALLRLPPGDPGPEPAHVFRNPFEAAADAAASGQAGELLAALALVAASVLALGFVSWARSRARLHDGTFPATARPRARTGTPGSSRGPPGSRGAALLGTERPRRGSPGGRLHRRRDRDGPRRPLPHKGGQWSRQKQTRAGAINCGGDRPQRPRDPDVRHRPRPEVRDPRMDRAARQEDRDGGRRRPARRARQVGEVQPPRPRHRGTRDRGHRRRRGRAPRAVVRHRARRLLLGPEVLHGRQPQPADRPLPARDYGRSDPRRRAEPLDRARAPGAP